MGEGLDHMYREAYHSSSSSRAGDEDEIGESSSLSGGSGDEADHHVDKSPTCSSSHLASFASQLPIKKGLSKFYQGKSQSFSSLSEVASVEDLAKKEAAPSRGKIKPSRSYACGLDGGNGGGGPAAAAAAAAGGGMRKGVPKKKGPRAATCASSIARTTSGSSFFAGSKPPHVPMSKNM